MMLWVLIGVTLAAFYLRLTNAYITHWKALPSKDKTYKAKAAIIIPFRDEASNLPILLDSIEQMKLAESVEWIFVNDHSSDEGPALIKARNIAGAQVLKLSDSSGKKAAIRLAWDQIDAEIFLHTDADCQLPEEWLSSMLAPFQDQEVAFVSGPVKYQKDSNFIQRFLQLDFAALNMVGAAHIQWNRPLMCNGANLAYRASAVRSLKEQYTSGDDVFLMQSIFAQGHKLFFQKDQRALVRTEGPQDWPAFIQQRLRWAGKNTGYGDLYNTAIKAGMWLVNLYLLIFMFCPGPLRITAFFLLACKLYADVKMFYAFRTFYGIKEFVAELILGQVYHIPYMALTPIFSKIVPFKWKGRRIRV